MRTQVGRRQSGSIACGIAMPIADGLSAQHQAHVLRAQIRVSGQDIGKMRSPDRIDRQMDGERPADQIRTENGDLRGRSRAVRILAVHFDNGDQDKRPGTGHVTHQPLDALDMPQCGGLLFYLSSKAHNCVGFGASP